MSTVINFDEFHRRFPTLSVTAFIRRSGRNTDPDKTSIVRDITEKEYDTVVFETRMLFVPTNSRAIFEATGRIDIDHRFAGYLDASEIEQRSFIKEGDEVVIEGKLNVNIVYIAQVENVIYMEFEEIPGTQHEPFVPPIKPIEAFLPLLDNQLIVMNGKLVAFTK